VLNVRRRLRYRERREELLQRFREIYHRNREKVIKRCTEYRRRNVKKYRVYRGIVTCPKCGRKGQLRHNIEVNLNTGNRLVYAVVYHSKSIRQGGKVGKKYLGTCYLGPVK
jgi:ribosomal protein L37AE/L43A